MRAMAVALISLTLVAGCSTGSGPTLTTASTAGASSPGVSPVSSPTVAGADTPTATTSARPTTTTPGTATTAAVATPVSSDACALTQLHVETMLGSAAMGQEFAAITVTNTSASPCSITGYAGISLRRNGAALGQPATRIGSAPTKVMLAHNGQAQAAITNTTTCQASISDHLRIYLPGQTNYVDEPLELRGCSLMIKAFVANG